MTDVPLKDFITLRIDYVEKLNDEKFKSSQLALQLQKIENDRNFDVLNRETGRISKIISEAIPREVFDLFKAELNTKLGDIKTAIAESGGKKQGFTAGWGVLLGVVVLVGIILTFILNLRGP